MGDIGSVGEIEAVRAQHCMEHLRELTIEPVLELYIMKISEKNIDIYP